MAENQQREGADDYVNRLSVMFSYSRTHLWHASLARIFGTHLWQAWRGEKAGCADLAMQSAVGVATTLMLPRLNKRFGTAVVWCCSELLQVLNLNPTHPCNHVNALAVGC